VCQEGLDVSAKYLTLVIHLGAAHRLLQTVSQLNSSGINIVKGFSQHSNHTTIQITLYRGMQFYMSSYSFPHSFDSEFKEAFPAGRFRPVCKIQAKRGASSAAVADQIKPPEWWHSTRIIQAFDSVLADKVSWPNICFGVV
jgi:hypothetical protein